MRASAKVALSVVAAAMLLPAPAARADSVCASGATAATNTVASDFNATKIPAGRTVWFNGVLDIGPVPPTQVTTLRVTGQAVTFAGNTVPVPDHVITFSPAATTVATTFDAGSNSWRTTAPTKDAGNIFLSGTGFPVTSDLPGAIKPVSWTATFVSSTPKLTVKWKWSAAVYTQFTGDLGAVGVKPVDNDKLSVYHNADHAGTPENYKAYLTAGARGGGGANFTGGYSGTANSIPCPPAATPQRLIVDTDIFSSADDVGALATAFALQLDGEASLLAIGINTRLDRPDVATASWKCAAAIAAYYGSDVPIGAHMPDDGTDVNTVDFIGPCAALGPASVPDPEPVVDVYRRALADAPDGSVVMASTGYFQNLADLLASPPDGFSPLSGRDLVARKVSMLVSMAGRYFVQRPENNLDGNPAAAQYVAANWPTKLVWAGYEVGDAVHTGDTLYANTPASSPVRAAYLAFVGPNNWYFSYDLLAVYHAIRPNDPLLNEVGPGTNAIAGDGSNVFTLGPGTQYYLVFADQTGVSSGDTALSATDAPALSEILNGLLDALPS